MKAEALIYGYELLVELDSLADISFKELEKKSKIKKSKKARSERSGRAVGLSCAGGMKKGRRLGKETGAQGCHRAPAEEGFLQVGEGWLLLT